MIFLSTFHNFYLNYLILENFLRLLNLFTLGQDLGIYFIDSIIFSNHLLFIPIPHTEPLDHFRFLSTPITWLNFDYSMTFDFMNIWLFSLIILFYYLLYVLNLPYFHQFMEFDLGNKFEYFFCFILNLKKLLSLF